MSFGVRVVIQQALYMTRSRYLVHVHHMEGKNEKSVSKVAKWPSLRFLALKSEFLLEFEFLKNSMIWMENVAGEHSLALQQYFPYEFFKFP